jgi:hypothetical protein
MTHPMTATSLLVTLAGLAGCSAHHPLILKNTTDIAIVATAPLAPHAAPVLVTEAALPESFRHEVIAQIDVGKAWYGRRQAVLEALAGQARALGANAVVEVETWWQPSGYSWWAPHGRGKAVRVEACTGSIDLAELGPLL